MQAKVASFRQNGVASTFRVDWARWSSPELISLPRGRASTEVEIIFSLSVGNKRISDFCCAMHFCIAAWQLMLHHDDDDNDDVDDSFDIVIMWLS